MRHKMSDINSIAAEYFALGWALAKVKGKVAYEHGWQTERVAVRSLDRLQGAQGVALVHELSGTCCVDIDDLAVAMPWLEERGLKALVLSGWVYQGNPKRFKVIFTTAVPLRHANTPGIEWRAHGNYDVLPPTIHPGSGAPYKWVSRQGERPPQLPDELLAVWQANMAARTPSPASPLDTAARTTDWRRDYAIAPIVAGCAQIRQMIDAPADIKEPKWLAVASVLNNCEGGEATWHEWSALDTARYNRAAAQAKFEYAHGLAPFGCSQFNDNGLCGACAYYGKVKTPLHIELVNLDAIPASALPSMPHERYRFHNGRTQVRTEQQTEAGGTEVVWRTIFEREVYLEEQLVHVAPSGGSESTIVVNVGGRKTTLAWRKFLESPAAALGDMLATISHLDPNLQKAAIRYIGAWKVTLDKTAIPTFATFGWHEDNFIIGEHELRPNQPPNNIRLRPGLAQQPPVLRGTVEGWSQAALRLFREGHEAQAFALIMGFAAPIMEATGERGGVYSMVGKSGQGKSTVQAAIGSIYGAFDALLTSEKDTAVARIIRLSQLHSLPMLAEELTMMDTETLMRFLYSASEGRDRLRGTVDGALRAVPPLWNTIVISSSNRSLIEPMLVTNNPAPAYRVLEDTVAIPKTAKFADGEAMIRSMNANAGIVGRYFLQKVVDSKPTLADRADVIRRRIADTLRAASEERIRINMLAAAVLAADILHTAGVIPITPKWVEEYGVRVIRGNRTSHAESMVSAVNLLSEFMRSQLHSMVRIVGTESGRALDLSDYTRTSRVYSRLEVSSDRLFIDRAALRAYVTSRSMGWAEFLSELRREGALHEGAQQITLTKGTVLPPSPPAQCIVLTASRLGGMMEMLNPPADFAPAPAPVTPALAQE
jgi:hypothetical protein